MIRGKAKITDKAQDNCRAFRTLIRRIRQLTQFIQGEWLLNPMKRFLQIVSLGLCMACLGTVIALAAENPFVSINDVTWTELGHNENDSMPIGNGDLAANVWTEQNGDLLVLVAKSDSWTELGKLVKLGRVRIQLTPNPFVSRTDFRQVLRLDDGSIEIKSGTNTVLVWIDANRPVIHVEAKLEHPATMQARLESWRTKTHPYDESSPDKGGLFEMGDHAIPLNFEADTVLPASRNQVAWYHFNPSSIYPIVLAQEHLESLLQKYPDPLLHRCFGGVLTGPGLVSSDDHTLKSAVPVQRLRLDLITLTKTNVPSPKAWKAVIDSLVKRVSAVPLDIAWIAHQRWWQEFWDRSWIHVSGTEYAGKVSQGFIMQRYMMATSSRGAFPTKFNGGLFTVGHDMAGNGESNAKDHNPDFREWGSSYWNQNNRLLYWPLVATGDFDLLKPWFEMYMNGLPLAEDRTRAYFHHGGAAFIETGYFWGLPNLNDFGWDNPTTEVRSEWMRYHIQGTLEVISQMLNEYDVTQDQDFARKEIIPFADAIVTYYNLHWPRGEDGKIRFAPVQSLETYQEIAVNPTPDIAGLKHVLPRLLKLPAEWTSPQQRSDWRKELADLPAIPIGKTANGKLPPFGEGDTAGTPTILPAESYGKTSNAENPELYVVFPYRLYGVGKPDLSLARNTFAARRFPWDRCWGQDGPQSAMLGLTAVAKKAAIDEFTDYGDQRFSWFWKAGGDWIPDLDDGGTGMITLESMLMQYDGKRIQLLPAWPSDWTVDFKLHAPYRTTVEGHVENGKITNLKVTPQSRAKDVVIVATGGQ
jgi:alpha-L-fucosidase 2